MIPLRVLRLYEYGAEMSSGPISTQSSIYRTPVIQMLSVQLEERITVPLTTELSAGEIRDMLGACVSDIICGRTFIVICADMVEFPAASRALAVSV